MIERDVPVAIRDSTTLRLNFFHLDSSKGPVVLSIHPYGKDNLPKRAPFGSFPIRYAHSPRGTLRLRWGPDRPAHLLVPVIP